MKERTSIFLHQGWFILCSSIGGLILSLMGLSIGWIVGTLLFASILSFWQPQKLKLKHVQKGIKVYWRQLGQFMIGIELAKSVNLSTLSIFQENGFTVFIVLMFSIIMSLGSGLLLYRFSNVGMITSLFATSPGGLATMPSMAEEVGANTGVVSVVQMLRIFLVVTIVPVALFFIGSTSTVGNSQYNISTNNLLADVQIFEWGQLIWTVVFILSAIGGVYLGKRVKLPAPWLVGTIIGVVLSQGLCTFIIGQTITFWWSHWFVVIGQILIGAGIGSGFKKSMFVGLHKILFISTMGTVLLIIAMFGCAYIVSEITGISLNTSVLAFAPGGVVEMSTASVSLHADSTFVVAVQTLRIVLVVLILPPFFNAVHKRKKKKSVEYSSHG
ncbi:AbrB family transcriptional regulator [Bacillus sp. Marseille-P3661]|uniref:AbrB family transcriptional regulator n=1 Tax=Bacillus sp. Marseille-P3661 TaxID=1936234 RepID=UPI0015E1ADFE|nr:AbrB family transcriptional regulator [Bacillus sp. Marseille-P3661]